MSKEIIIYTTKTCQYCKEIKELLKELAVLSGFEDEQEIGFTNEWGDDFEFIPDFDINFNPEEDK